MQDIERILEGLNEDTRRQFNLERRILSFREFLELLAERPYSLTRTAPQYMRDMMDHFGAEMVPGIGGEVRRFKVFDDPAGGGAHAAIGQEEAQNEIYRCLSEFVHRRQADKLLLLHGPNGSAKTTLVSVLVRGLEAYSRTDAGLLLRFNWIFSEAAEGARVGFAPGGGDERPDSFAFLEP